jgi:prepilin-type N-terminal cleavage/methylation domain-containing protein
MTAMISVTGRRRAFTLVEMLLVVVIMGIAAGMTLPSLRRTAEMIGLDEACRRVYCISGTLQELARQEDNIYYLKIDRDAGEFTPLRKTETGKFAVVQTSGARFYKLPEGVGISIAPKAMRGIYFYPDMTSDSASIELSNGSGRKMMIEYSSMSGSINIR